MKSILQKDKECFVCRTTQNLAEHHVIYGNANRKMSEKYGLKIWLCNYHHNMSDEGIHFNKSLDLEVKKIAQAEFEKTHTREEWHSIFGKSYL